MRRFFVPAQDWTEGPFPLPSSEATHARRVLRLRPGQRIVIFDGQGREVDADVVSVTRDAVHVAVSGPVRVDQPARAIVLGAGMPRSSTLDTIIRHATELGATEIRPVLTERSFRDTSHDSTSRRLERRQRIAREAAKQCRRATVPRVTAPEPLEGFLAAWHAAQTPKLGLVAYEGTPVRQRLGSPEVVDDLAPDATIWLLIGPEGGLAAAEVSSATDAGFIPFSLGPRTLRAETAVLACLAIVQHRWGDL